MTRVLCNETQEMFVDRLCKENNIHTTWYDLFRAHGALLMESHTEIYRYMDLDPSDDGLVFPKAHDWFRVFQMNLEEIRVVLLGQDPYHNPGQAMGYAFSVPRGIHPPPSLLNIFKEIQSSHPDKRYDFTSGDLTRWAKEEHVFLLNAALSVKRNKPGSHMNLWSKFTDATIQYISQRRESTPTLVYLLLGNFAKAKQHLISEKQQHMIVTAAHPSPLSAYKGFFGSNVFRKVDDLLEYPIDWQN
jgi:uracil-DNA glycosylase